MSSGSCFAMYRIVTARNSRRKLLKSHDWHVGSSRALLYEQSYVCLIYNTVFTENLLSKTCLQALRERRLIRRHVDQQARVFHLTASVVNSRRSVCQQRAALQNHLLSKHVESALDQERPKISTHTHAHKSGFLGGVPRERQIHRYISSG